MDNKTSNEDFIIREDFVNEQKLRSIIKLVIENTVKKNKIYENATIKLVQKSIKEALDNKKRSTGINVLYDLLKKVLPILEQDYKQMTTNEQQRESFRSHIINATQNLLAPIRNYEGSDESDIDIKINEAARHVVEEIPDPKKLIDPFGDEKEKQAEKEQKAAEAEKAKQEEEDQKPFKTDELKDATGAKFAEATFTKIEKQIGNAYEMLSDASDKEDFYDYLITNLKLHFDRMEEEMMINPEEPESPVDVKTSI